MSVQLLQDSSAGKPTLDQADSRADSRADSQPNRHPVPTPRSREAILADLPSIALTFTHKIESFVLPEDPIHRCDLVQSKKATPHDGRSRRSVILAIQIAAEPGDPQHNLRQ